MYPINIIGIGQGKKDLTQKHLELILDCDVLAGGKRQLEMFDYPDKQKIFITAHLNRLVEIIKKEMVSKKIVVLASGDPLFYGIGTTLTRHFDKHFLNIHSNISSVSAAFAAIKTPWHDAKIISLHGKEQALFSFAQLARETKVAFLTDLKMTPHAIAAALVKAGLSDFRLCVLEKLGDLGEKIRWFESPDLLKEELFSQPNIVILQKQAKERNMGSHGTHIGMEDSMFKHSKGLITKSEIRSITLSKLKLIKRDHVMWDIGSGSGSIAIEASLQLPHGHVTAMEKHEGRIRDIAHNIKRFNCSNVTVLNTAFPGKTEDLKTPDRIFIGGGGEKLEQILEIACAKLALPGVMVINTVLLQNLETAVRVLKKYKFNPSVVQIQISRSKGMPFGDRLEALNPVWIISGSTP